MLTQGLNPFVQSRPLRILLLTCLLSATSALAMMHPAQAMIPTVTTADDELNSDGDCSLREAIRAANLNIAVDACPAGEDSDVIILPAGVFVLRIQGRGDNVGASGDLDVSGTLTIKGVGASRTIIDGNGIDRVFDVYGGLLVRFERLTIQGGDAGTTSGHAGGGIRSAGQVRLDRVVMQGNRADFGGAISVLCDVFGRRLVITNSTLRDNSATNSGGAISTFDECPLVINGSTISGNRAERGGGIYTWSPTSIVNSTISGNSAIDGGGLFETVGEAYATNIFSSTISGNLATGDGSGIYNDDILHVFNTTISGNVADGSGGGLANFFSATFNNVTIANNQADGDGDGSGNGGGILVAGDSSLSNTIVATNRDAGGETPDCAGPLRSRGYNLLGNSTGCRFEVSGPTDTLVGNLIDVPARIGPLRNNGGPTATHMLFLSSPALDAGNPAPPANSVLGTTCRTVDQRGIARPRDGNGDGVSHCDMGAVER